MIQGRAPDRDLAFTDAWGLRRMALLSDHMEFQGFVGLEVVPGNSLGGVRKGQWAVDVGANVGLVTGPLCQLVGSSGVVWAIEPVPRNVERLRQLKEMNVLNCLRIFAGALSSTSGTARLRLPVRRESGWASFTASWHTGGLIEVGTWPLDELVFATAPDRPVSFLKIDVEGFELEVLRGAERTLMEMRPTVLCEFNDIVLRDAGSSSGQLLEAFERVGYAPAKGWEKEAAKLDGELKDILLEAR
jgi:FkbM family methyltransferase